MVSVTVVKVLTITIHVFTESRLLSLNDVLMFDEKVSVIMAYIWTHRYFTAGSNNFRGRVSLDV